MTTVYLIRHAEAEGNVYRRCHGHYNSLITARGLMQVAELAERFRDEKIDAVYSSDLYRTMKTASAIFEPHSLPLVTDSRLRELGMGVWEDITFGELQRNEAERLTDLTKTPEVWSVEGSETFADVSSRMCEAVTEIAERHQNQAIALFSHGMAIRAFSHHAFGDENTQGHMDNTAVTSFEYENGKFKLLYYNDNSHLSDGNSTLAKQRWVRDNRGYDDSNLVFEQTAHGVYTLYLSGRVCGTLELDTENLADEGIGVVRRYKLHEDIRGSGLGIQLLGQAISDYRKLGRRKLRVEFTPEFIGNTGFFERLGFKRVTSDAFELDIFIPEIGGRANEA